MLRARDKITFLNNTTQQYEQKEEKTDRGMLYYLQLDSGHAVVDSSRACHTIIDSL